MRHDLQWICTNEDMHALEVALNPQPADAIVAIVGGGEQVFSLAQHLDTGSVLGIDINPYQITQGYLKQALLSYGRKEYFSFLHKRKKHVWRKLKHVLPERYVKYGEGICSFQSGEIDKKLVMRDIYERIPWLADNQHFARVAQHAQNVSFQEQDITKALRALPSESVDKVYLSNVFITEPVCGQELCRVIRSGRRVYGLDMALPGYLLLLSKTFKRCFDLEERIAAKSKGLEYSFQNLGGLFVGVKE